MALEKDRTPEYLQRKQKTNWLQVAVAEPEKLQKKRNSKSKILTKHNKTDPHLLNTRIVNEIFKVPTTGLWILLSCVMRNILYILENSLNRDNVKGHLISKAIYGLLASSKKRTDEFDLFAFLLFTRTNQIKSVHFLEDHKLLSRLSDL